MINKKILVLNGLKETDQDLVYTLETLEDVLKKESNDVTIISLKDKKIAHCVGCFKCWIKTPGECIMNDDARDIAKQIINSDIIICLSPVTFGGYNSEIKKVFDKIIPR